MSYIVTVTLRSSGDVNFNLRISLVGFCCILSKAKGIAIGTSSPCGPPPGGISGKVITWPSNPYITFNEPVFDEEGPHYDNYEEYYRPYTDLKDLETIKYMHTNPIYSDTDGDNILDPDDYEPIGWPNCGISPGAADRVESKIDEQKPEIKDVLKNNNIIQLDIETVDEIVDDANQFDLQIDITNSETKFNIKETKNLHLPDTENDGI